MNKVYEYVTENIIKQLEQGIIPWHKPWTYCNSRKSKMFAINYVTRKPYRGINTLLLDKPGEYITFKQVQALKGTVKKGAKARMVVFYMLTDKKTNESEEIEDGQEKAKTQKYFILRYYNVFHLSDIEGIESKIVPMDEDNTHPDDKFSPIDEAEAIFEGYKDRPKLVNFDLDKAYYRPSQDIINMPHKHQFTKPEEYYNTLFHEGVHSTGHPKRLNRFTGAAAIAAFGSETYSFEELVAEIGAAMLCGVSGIGEMTIKNSAAYIQSWLKVLKDDKRLIVKVAAKAQKAVDFILGVKEKSEETGE